jgi:hypothetical protein
VLIKVGDRVRLLAVPPAVLALTDERDEIGTKALFKKCVGHTFTVRGVETGDTPAPVELWVRDGEDDEDRVGADTVWVEVEFLEIV